MSQLKNAEGIVSNLQRIFFYGDEQRETSRVNSFLEYLSTKINPFTQRPYELGARSLYRYICGDQHFPIDLMVPLIDWSADEKLMTDYNIRPSVEAKEKLKTKRERLANELEVLKKKIEQIDWHIEGFEQLTLVGQRRTRK
jgi:hypothetical protein